MTCRSASTRGRDRQDGGGKPVLRVHRTQVNESDPSSLHHATPGPTSSGRGWHIFVEVDETETTSWSQSKKSRRQPPVGLNKKNGEEDKDDGDVTPSDQGAVKQQ